MKIARVSAREIYDSRGWPTVLCQIALQDGAVFEASVPSGISRSSYEAVDMRDGGKRLFGQGVLKATEIIEKKIAPMLEGKEPNVIEIDQAMLELDGTYNKSKLGGNAMLAVSLAACRAHAYVEMMRPYELMAYICEYESVSLPAPLFNVVNGGMHAHNALQVQEFMVIPAEAESYRQALEMGATLFHTVEKMLVDRKKLFAVGDEGGLSCLATTEEQVLDLLSEAIVDVEQQYGGRLLIVLDIAATHFYDMSSKSYRWRNDYLSSQELCNWYAKIVADYPIYALEDPCSQDDWDGWKLVFEKLSSKIHLIGDDIFATRCDRIIRGLEEEVADVVLIKPNQAGTLTEALQAAALSKKEGCLIAASHRSGETNDSFIAEFAVGVSAQYIKAGGCSRGERLAKHNMLLEIERELFSSYETRG